MVVNEDSGVLLIHAWMEERGDGTPALRARIRWTVGAEPRRGEAAVATPGAALDCVRNWLELLAAFDEVAPTSPAHGPGEPS